MPIEIHHGGIDLTVDPRSPRQRDSHGRAPRPPPRPTQPDATAPAAEMPPTSPVHQHFQQRLSRSAVPEGARDASAPFVPLGDMASVLQLNVIHLREIKDPIIIENEEGEIEALRPPKQVVRRNFDPFATKKKKREEGSAVRAGAAAHTGQPTTPAQAGPSTPLTFQTRAPRRGSAGFAQLQQQLQAHATQIRRLKHGQGRVTVAQTTPRKSTLEVARWVMQHWECAGPDPIEDMAHAFSIRVSGHLRRHGLLKDEPRGGKDKPRPSPPSTPPPSSRPPRGRSNSAASVRTTHSKASAVSGRSSHQQVGGGGRQTFVDAVARLGGKLNQAVPLGRPPRPASSVGGVAGSVAPPRRRVNMLLALARNAGPGSATGEAGFLSVQPASAGQRRSSIVLQTPPNSSGAITPAASVSPRNSVGQRQPVLQASPGHSGASTPKQVLVPRPPSGASRRPGTGGSGARSVRAVGGASAAANLVAAVSAELVAPTRRRTIAASSKEEEEEEEGQSNESASTESTIQRYHYYQRPDVANPRTAQESVERMNGAWSNTEAARANCEAKLARKLELIELRRAQKLKTQLMAFQESKGAKCGTQISRTAMRHDLKRMKLAAHGRHLDEQEHNLKQCGWLRECVQVVHDSKVSGRLSESMLAFVFAIYCVCLNDYPLDQEVLFALLDGAFSVKEYERGVLLQVLPVLCTALRISSLRFVEWLRQSDVGEVLEGVAAWPDRTAQQSEAEHDQAVWTALREHCRYRTARRHAGAGAAAGAVAVAVGGGGASSGAAGVAVASGPAAQKFSRRGSVQYAACATVVKHSTLDTGPSNP